MKTVNAIEIIKIQVNEYHLHLPGGEKILVRPVCPEDRACLLQGFRQLSPQSKRFRFLSSLKRLPEPYLSYLTEIDNVNHVAWGAKDLDHDLMGVGVGRYIRLEEEPQSAEMALTVLDAYQRKGIGSVLFSFLIRSALENGITRFRGYFNRENQALLALLRRYQPRIIKEHSPVWQLEVDLKPEYIAGLV